MVCLYENEVRDHTNSDSACVWVLTSEMFSYSTLCTVSDNRSRTCGNFNKGASMQWNMEMFTCSAASDKFNILTEDFKIG